ncbi:MAG: hypothetical protein H6745_22520 [Deltaproteobacteria bacterium]|nr:hypothetical protein [Deltaproteobacteria bacterium]
MRHDLLAALVLAALPLACSDGGADGAPVTPPDPEPALGPIAPVSAALTLRGLTDASALDPALVTLDTSPEPSWLVLGVAGAEPVTARRDGADTELLPAATTADLRAVFVRVRADGTPGRVAAVPIPGDTEELRFDGGLACGDAVWAVLRDGSGARLWVFRADPMLAEPVASASFAAEAAGGGDLVEIGLGRPTCADGRFYATMRHAGRLVVTPPSGRAITVTTAGYETQVLDLDRLFDRGEINASQLAPGREVGALSAGADGALLVAHAGPDGGGVDFARLDPARGTLSPVGQIAAAVFVRAMLEASGGDVRLLCAIRPTGSSVALADVTFTDATVRTICALQRDGAAPLPLELHAAVSRALTDDAGRYWLAGAGDSADPRVAGGGGVANDGIYLAAVDPATGDLDARGLWGPVPGRSPDLLDLFPAAGVGECEGAASAAVLVAAGEVTPRDDVFTTDIDLVLAGPSDTACTDRVASVQVDATSAAGVVRVSATPRATCAHARYLAALTAGMTLVVAAGGEATVVAAGPDGLDLVAFSPATCRVARR